MLIRVVIVLLVVLNLGAGVWWALRPAPREVAVDARVPGIAMLEIVGGPARARPTPVVSSSVATPPLPTTPPAAPIPTPAPLPGAVSAPQCASLGPFATADLAKAAQAGLTSATVRVAVRTEAARGRGWRVVIPPVADATQAAELATRIGAAGITDYFVMRDGVDANAIALGRYGGETAARRRAQVLIDAGFNARAEPVGTPSYWLDVTAGDAAALAGLLARSGAIRQQPLDCAAPPAAAAG